ncbi:MAG: hypothetical protein IJD93_00665 [Ruminococcus sp.]|nr:hypothetical protein [Ruminococcus sp.]
MTYDIYRYIFIGAAILCGVMFIVSVLVFIFLNIPKVVSDLSGATARKAIKNIREQNEASGDKSYKVSAFNEARGKLTDKISPSGNVIHQYQAQMRGIDTTKIDTQELHIDEPASQTTVLDNAGVGETVVLTETMPTGETTVLSDVSSGSAFTIEYEITFIHTNEIITVEAIG